MGCGCGKRKTNAYTVTLPGGTKIGKATEEMAVAFARRHPGATVSKTPAGATAQ